MEHYASNCVGYPTDLISICRIAFRIFNAEFCDLALASPFTHQQIASIQQWEKILRPALDQAQTMAMQPQVTDNFGL